MMDRLRAMKIFLAVADAGSLSGAARRLDEPLTNISRHLSQLEEHLGCTLLIRGARRAALTPEGEDYRVTCRLLLDDLEAGEARLSARASSLAGEIVLTAPVAFGRMHVLPVLAEFLEAEPGIRARLLLLDRWVDLLEEGVDLAIRVGDLPDSALLSVPIGSLRYLCCASPSYLERAGRPERVTDLAQHDCIAFGASGSGRWIFHSANGNRKALRLTPRLEVTTAEAAVAAAEMGLGVARVLSYQAAQSLREGRLQTVLEDADHHEIPVRLLRWPSRVSNPRVRAFLDFAAPRLRQRLAETP